MATLHFVQGHEWLGSFGASEIGFNSGEGKLSTPTQFARPSTVDRGRWTFFPF